MIDESTYGFSKADAEQLVGLIGMADVEFEELKPLPLSAGQAFFRLMEDVTSSNGAFWARRTNRADDELGEWTQVWNWDGILDGAVAGYRGLYALVSGEWVIDSGACVPTPCEHEGEIIVGTPPLGTVDTEYAGHTVTAASVTSLAASGLPSGLTMNSSGVISGTPTVAGIFYVTITGVSNSCDLTRVMVLTIEDA